MAGNTNKYNGIEKYIFSDLYLFFLKYKDIPDNDIYWETCISDARVLNFKWKNHPFARALIADTMSQLEHIIKHTTLDGYTREQWEVILQLPKEGKPFNPTNPFNNGK